MHMVKCEESLQPIFNVTPLNMTILTYGNRDSFINDLQIKLNYSKASAERFRNGGAPKPSKGLFLVPPKMTGRYFCHEIVHKYVEMIIPESKIAQMKWFDEGSAEYFSAAPFNYQVKNNMSAIIPIEEMISKTDWSKLFDKQETRNLAYRQAHSMFNFFIEKYGIKTYFEFLQKMNKDSFESVLRELTGTNLQDFFADWKNNMAN